VRSSIVRTSIVRFWYFNSAAQIRLNLENDY
jgi:hypothetical protein